MIYDWADLAFGSKKPLTSSKATFILAPREISKDRFKQIIKKYLPHGNIILGIAKEKFVDGFDGQTQFKTLDFSDVEDLVHKVNLSSPTKKIFPLKYLQKEAPFIIEKLNLKQAVAINGSWNRSFHLSPNYFTLVKSQVPIEFISPFTSEDEAKQYAETYSKQIQKELNLGSKINKSLNETEIAEIANQSAKQSYDHTFQTGAALAKKSGTKYKLLLTAYNEIVPYQTYAMHFGASREKFLSPANDLNHYDTVHAEVQAMLNGLKLGIKLDGISLFVNLMPCPVCSRILIKSGIQEIIYQHDHSDGYALKVLSQAGITVRRIVI